MNYVDWMFVINAIGNYLGDVLLLLGAFFFLTSTVGIMRMNSTLLRLHSASVADSAGVLVLMVGLMLKVADTQFSFKLLLLISLIWITFSAISQLLARAVYQAQGGKNG